MCSDHCQSIRRHARERFESGACSGEMKELIDSVAAAAVASENKHKNHHRTNKAPRLLALGIDLNLSIPRRRTARAHRFPTQMLHGG